MNRLFVAIALLFLASCAQQEDRSPRGGQGSTASPAFGIVSGGSHADTAYEARIRQQRAFAALPDRGELISYVDTGAGHGARAQGAYTWHRVDISEEHALRAIVGRHLRVPTPSGKALDIRYDHHIEHPSGDLTWVGHVEGRPEAQTIITFGAEAVYGSIGQPGKRSLRLTTHNGAGWVVETDPAKLVGIASAGANPRESDALAVPKTRMRSANTPLVQAGAQATQAMATATATATASTTIDVLIGYTQGYASATPGVMTRLNQLVAVGNEALANSQVSARIRLVHAMQVTYTDTSTNESALEQLTGYDTGTDQYTTPNAAFNALRGARETYGADLVALVRDFRDPEQDGCGIAWLIGGGQSGISPGDGQDYFGYSVVSDGYDENGGETYYCREETLIHELAHNLGSQHDREAARGGDGTLDPDDYGVFPYSFGLKTAATAGNFYTIMAYGEETQQDYRIFSNPRVTAVCGGRPCGTTNEDNSRSLGLTSPVIAGFRTSVVAVGPTKFDFNGDGRADILWRNSSTGANVIWWSANSATRKTLPTTPPSWVASSGDYNGDGRTDILWHSNSTGANVIWRSGSAATKQSVATTPTSWRVAGSGDYNGDGRADILWRNSAGANVIWRSGSAATKQTVATTPPSWIASSGDYNGDGRTDILWHSNSTGANVIWRSGSAATKQSVATTPTSWRVAGSGDYNGDGRADILWRNSAGANVIWRSGSAATKQAVSAMSTAWRAVGSGDYNGDGRSDILWRNSSTGQNVIWYSANSATPQVVNPVTSLAWSVAGATD